MAISGHGWIAWTAARHFQNRSGGAAFAASNHEDEAFIVE
jgi:hypothetical protein